VGPVEWDLASVIWNAKILEEDHTTVSGILEAYREAGGRIDESVAAQSRCSGSGHDDLVSDLFIQTPILTDNRNYNVELSGWNGVGISSSNSGRLLAK